jgi:sugar transferase (PEP-CTERM/EpsH1 system associated)
LQNSYKNQKMKYPINVLHVVLSLKFGGLERMVTDLVMQIDKSKFHCAVCCLDEYGDFAEELRARGIEVFLAGRKPGLDLQFPWKLSKIIKNFNAHIVHTHNAAPMLYGTFAAKLGGIRVIVNTKHDREKKETSWIAWSIAAFFNDAIVAISHDAKKCFLNNISTSADKIHVIYNGINVHKFISAQDNTFLKNELRLFSSEIVIATVSRLSKEKDVFTLLNAFAELRHSITNLKLLVVGDGKLKADLENHAIAIGVKADVIFLGFRKDVQDILKIADVFLLTSLTEGISLSILEAMASGKPVVATRVGGNPEVVETGITGVLADAGMPLDISKALLYVLKDKGRASKMGEEGLKRVESMFSLAHMTDEYEKLYSCLLKEKHLI